MQIYLICIFLVFGGICYGFILSIRYNIFIIRIEMVVILFSFYLCFYILIFSKILLSENVKVDKFGFFKEYSMVVQNMFLIYLFFFVMCSLYIVLYAYDF